MDNANASAIEKLMRIFPQCVTERKGEDGAIEKAIDIEKLIEEIKPNITEEAHQRYEFTWPGKRLYSRLANAAAHCALRPCREESRGRDGSAGAFDSANLYIEGDNLDVLKILRETYLGKVKMIYIDPPYNTGNDFIYRDRFVQDEDEYLERSGQLGGDGARLFQNTESNGRFHTDWLNMIYPRLKVARSLLADDGVIFISIDDNEAANLRKVCDELFGEGNFVGQIAWRRTDNQPNIGYLARIKEYILIFAKSPKFSLGRLPLTEKAKAEYRYSDEKGLFRRSILLDKTRGRKFYTKATKLGNTLNGPWMVSEKEFDRMEANGEIYWTESGDGQPYGKIYLSESRGQIPNDFWGIEYGTNQRGSLETEKLFGRRCFDFPKPVSLIGTIVKLGATAPDSLILDFFSGSATTAHAAMQLNAEDGGRRRFIMVQLPEPCAEGSEAFKAGYSNICEIGKERIRRAGDQILRGSLEALEKEGLIEKCCLDAEIDAAAGIVPQAALGALRRFGYRICPELLADAQSEEVSSKLSALSSKLSMDTGFRVLKVDSSNMLDVCVTAPEFTADSIYEENIKADRTADDLLIQAMLDVGIELSSFIEERQIEGKRVFLAGDGALAACFDEALSCEAILQIAKLKPRCFYMRDAGYACDCDADNFEQIFRTYSPGTRKRVL